VTRRAMPRGLAIGLIGLIALGVVLLLGRGGTAGSVRTVLGCVALLVVPSLLFGSLIDDEGDALVRFVGGLVTTLAACAIFGFAAYEFGYRVASAVFAIPLVVLIVVLVVVRSSGPVAPKPQLAPLGLAAALGLAALLGAWITHEALPATPIEHTFSIEAGRATATPGNVSVTVAIARVEWSQPIDLSLIVGSSRSSVTASPGQTTIRLSVALPKSTVACPESVQVQAANGAYLAPRVTCVGW
jgi:hypothetical protein